MSATPPLTQIHQFHIQGSAISVATMNNVPMVVVRVARYARHRPHRRFIGRAYRIWAAVAPAQHSPN